jgi:hypothetical protein
MLIEYKHCFIKLIILLSKVFFLSSVKVIIKIELIFILVSLSNFSLEMIRTNHKIYQSIIN